MLFGRKASRILVIRRSLHSFEEVKGFYCSLRVYDLAYFLKDA